MVDSHNEEEIIEIEDVEVVNDEGARLYCLVGDQEVWVDKIHVPNYSEVQEKGDVGTMSLPGWVVDELELII